MAACSAFDEPSRTCASAKLIVGQGTVLDPEVKVRRVGVPAVTHQGEHLTAADLVAHMDLHSSPTKRLLRGLLPRISSSRNAVNFSAARTVNGFVIIYVRNGFL